MQGYVVCNFQNSSWMDEPLLSAMWERNLILSAQSPIMFFNLGIVEGG